METDKRDTLVIVQVTSVETRSNETIKKCSLHFTPIQILSDTIKTGTTLKLENLYFSSGYGSAQEKGKKNYLWTYDSTASTLLLALNKKNLEKDSEFMLHSYDLQTDLSFTEKGVLKEQLTYIPSALYVLDKTVGFVGSSSIIDQVKLSSPELTTTRLHSFESTSRKVIDAFCFSPKSSLLVAVDDTIWPKYGFLFNRKSTSEFELLTKFNLPQSINEQYESAVLAGSEGTTLVLTTTYFHRGGSGQSLVIMDIKKNKGGKYSVNYRNKIEEFLQRETTKPDLMYVPEKYKNSKDKIQSLPHWKGFGYIENKIYLGAQERGIIIVYQDKIGAADTSAKKVIYDAWQTKGAITSIDVDGNCLVIKVIHTTIYALVSKDEKYKIVVVDGTKDQVIKEHPLEIDLSNGTPTFA